MDGDFRNAINLNREFIHWATRGGASLPKNGHTVQNEPDGQREFEESGAFFGDTHPGCSHQIPYKLICKARLRRQLHRPAFFPAIHLDAILSHRREEMR